MNEKANTARGDSRVLYEEFRVHSTVSKCVYLPVKHEQEVSNAFNIQTECSALKLWHLITFCTYDAGSLKLTEIRKLRGYF